MNAHHVYRIYDTAGRLIYVGSTRHLFARLDYHRRYAWWGHQAARATAKVYATKEEGSRAEVCAIHSENPRWNIKGKTNCLHERADYVDYATALLNRPHKTDPTIKEIWRVARYYRHAFKQQLPVDLASLPEDPLAWARKTWEGIA